MKIQSIKKTIGKGIISFLLVITLLVNSLLPFSSQPFHPASVQAATSSNTCVASADPAKSTLTRRVGAVELATVAKNIANLNDITGAYYDSNLDRIVIYGQSSGSTPKYNPDDIAVAIKSIFYGNSEPGILITDDPNNPNGSNVIVSYDGGIKNTHLGSVVYNVDYKLKQYWLGYDPNGVRLSSVVPSYKGVPDRYLSLTSSPTGGNVSSIDLFGQVNVKSDDAHKSFTFTNVQEKAISTPSNPNNDPVWNKAASDFAADITAHFDQYAQESTGWSQDKQLVKLIAVLKWLSDKAVITDYHWGRDYTPKFVSTPTIAKKIMYPANNNPYGMSVSGDLSFTTPNQYATDDGTANGFKNASQAVSSAKEDTTWTFTNNGQQYQAVAVAADAFKSLGAYNTSVADMNIPIAGDLSLSFQRSYSSYSVGQYGIGQGWDMMPARLYPNQYPVSQNMTINGGVTYATKVAFDSSDGHETFTYSVSANGYTPDDPSYHSKLLQNSDGTFVATSAKQIKYNFNTTYVLTKILDKDGNAITYTYDSSGNLMGIADTKNHQLTFAYNPQLLISSVTDWFGRKVQYTYDTNGNLTGVMDPNGNTITYGYDTDSHLITTTDRTGQVILTNTYGQDARIATQKDVTGLITTSAYDNNNRTITLTDSLGRSVKNFYDTKSRILQQIDPLGKAVVYTYGTEFSPLTVTDKNGNKITNTYDTNGNLTSVTYPDTKQVTYTYDANNRVTQISDGRYGSPAKVTAFTYSSSGDVTKSVQGGNATNYTYDATGEVLTVTDPLNHLTTWTRNTLGNMLTQTDANNNTANYTYDAIGRLTKVTDADGKTLSYTYDNNGNVLTAIDAIGTTTSVYDKENRLTSRTAPNNTVMSYGYSPTGVLNSVTDQASNLTAYGYDTYRNLISQTDALNHTTTETYDTLNHETKSTTPLGKAAQWTYDANGNISQRTDENNAITKYTYDAFNRLTKITYPDTKTVVYAYDNRGNMVSMVDPVGTASYVYDTFDRMTQATSEYGLTIKYTYDAADNLKTLTYPDNKVVTYGYDANNQMSSVTDWNNKTTTYTYNKNGSLATRAYPSTLKTTYTYDGANQLIGVKHTLGANTLVNYSYLRDKLGNITSASESGTGAFSTATGTQTSVFTYDVLSRITGATFFYPNTTLTYTYDKVGNMLTKTNTSDTSSNTYTYDNDNKLTKANSLIYSYDNNGNVVKKATSPFATNFTYDFENRLKTYGKSFGSNYAYTYDGLGNRIANGDTTFGNSARYAIDTSGNLSRVLVQTNNNTNSISSWFVYGLGLISEGSDLDVTREYYLEDGLGNTRNTASYYGGPGSIQEYEPYGGSLWGSGGNPFFAFQEQQLIQENGMDPIYYMRARYYDPSIGRFLSKDPVKGPLSNPQSNNGYNYANDNPINMSDPSGNNPLVILAAGAFITGGVSLAFLEVGGGVQGCFNYMSSSGKNATFGGAALSTAAGAQRGAESGEGQFAMGLAFLGVMVSANSPEYSQNGIAKANNVVNAIEENGGKPLPGYKGGSVFQNLQNKLPDGSYIEHDLDPLVKGINRGSQRVIIDKNTGSAYYTPDHYNTFIKLK